MTDLTIIREQFYKKFITKYNTTKEEIVRILRNSNYESFKENEIYLYNFCVDTFFQAKEEEKKRKVARNITYPCPVKDCTGIKVFNKGNSSDWECSAGGDSHYNAMRLAKIWKKVHEDSLITIAEKAKEFIDSLEVEIGQEKKEATV